MKQILPIHCEHCLRPPFLVTVLPASPKLDRKSSKEVEKRSIEGRKFAADRLLILSNKCVFFVAVRPFCAPWACLYIISGAGVVSGTPHPAV